MENTAPDPTRPLALASGRCVLVRGLCSVRWPSSSPRAGPPPRARSARLPQAAPSSPTTARSAIRSPGHSSPKQQGGDLLTTSSAPPRPRPVHGRDAAAAPAHEAGAERGRRLRSGRAATAADAALAARRLAVVRPRRGGQAAPRDAARPPRPACSRRCKPPATMMPWPTVITPASEMACGRRPAGLTAPVLGLIDHTLGVVCVTRSPRPPTR